MWLMVLARGLIPPFPRPPGTPTLFDTEFLRTRPEAFGGKPVVLSRRALRGRVDVAPCWWSFCWCRNSKSRRAKHLAHCGHSKGFSFVCERSCRFRCSNLANDRVHVVQICGRGLSVFGRGKGGAAVVGDVAGRAVWDEAAFDTLISLRWVYRRSRTTHCCCYWRLRSRRLGYLSCAPASCSRLVWT
jgi:hypothetical protein